MSSKYYNGTGRRKTSVARVRLYPAPPKRDGVPETGSFVVNDKPVDQYFSREADVTMVYSPLRATNMMEQFQVSVKVSGGGVTGQAGAVSHGIARALQVANPELRQTLRQGGFLTRDARAKERKKPGLKRARKAPQYTKR
jgi:small subunit ribosomal protein S9